MTIQKMVIDNCLKCIGEANSLLQREEPKNYEALKMDPKFFEKKLEEYML